MNDTGKMIEFISDLILNSNRPEEEKISTRISLETKHIMDKLIGEMLPLLDGKSTPELFSKQKMVLEYLQSVSADVDQMIAQLKGGTNEAK